MASSDTVADDVKNVLAVRDKLEDIIAKKTNIQRQQGIKLQEMDSEFMDAKVALMEEKQLSKIVSLKAQEVIRAETCWDDKITAVMAEIEQLRQKLRGIVNDVYDAEASAADAKLKAEKSVVDVLNFYDQSKCTAQLPVIKEEIVNLEKQYEELKKKNADLAEKIAIALGLKERRQKEDRCFPNPKVSKILIKAAKRNLKTFRLRLIEAKAKYSNLVIENENDDD